MNCFPAFLHICILLNGELKKEACRSILILNMEKFGRMPQNRRMTEHGTV